VMRREFHINRRALYWYTPDDEGGVWCTAIVFWPPHIKGDYTDAKCRAFYQGRGRYEFDDTPEYWAERAEACSGDKRKWRWPKEVKSPERTLLSAQVRITHLATKNEVTLISDSEGKFPDVTVHEDGTLTTTDCRDRSSTRDRE